MRRLTHGTKFLAVIAACAPSLAAADVCGGAGERPCHILDGKFYDIGGPCESGLSYIPLTACVPKIDKDAATAKAEEVADLAKAIGEAYADFQRQDPLLLVDLIAAVEAQDTARVQEIILESQYFDEVLALMRALGMNTFTVGLGGGGSLIVGGGGETGVALDTGLGLVPRAYGTGFWSVGYQVGLGADLVFGGWIPDNRCIGGDSQGRSAQVDVGPGVGLGLWYDDGTFIGASVPVGIGGVGFGAALVQVSTSVVGVQCPDPNIRPDPVPIIVDPEPTPEPEPEPEPQVVTIVPGDTLWAIASNELGDPFRYVDLYAANSPPLTDPDLIRPGQVLTIPVAD